MKHLRTQSDFVKERAFNIITYSLLCFVVINAFSLLWNFFDWSTSTSISNGKFSTDLSKVRKTVLNTDADVSLSANKNCSFWDCVNIYRCGQNGFDHLTIYVYPLQEYVSSSDRSAAVLTKEYFQILQAVYESEYYTSNPNEACLYLPSIDLLNQNLIEQQLVNKVLGSLEYWEKGENHVIFNMLPGSFPQFNRTIDVGTDRAIIVGGGFDSWSYRPGFDISIPVWSALINKGKTSNEFQRKYLLIVAQQNILPPQSHILQTIAQDNPGQVLLLQRCSDSKQSPNERECKSYSKTTSHLYPNVLLSGTFCLIGRSFRLGQPDFLEILSHNCIPVIAIDNYILPFSEVIDWTLAAIRIREADTHSIIEVLKNVSPVKILELHQQGRWLYDTYFRNIRTMTLSVLKVLDDRIFPHRARNLRQWNTAELNYKVPPSPLFLPIVAPKNQGFTAVVLTYDRVESLFILIQKLAVVPSLQSILVIWNNQNKSPPHISTFPMISKPLKVIQTPANKLSNRFYPYPEIETECVLTIDDDIIMLTADELDFGFEVWREFPDRIVGFPSRLHVWDNATMQWHYESEWTNQISMVLTGAAFHHKFWNHAYTYNLPTDIKNWVDERMNCEDIAMNFLVANITNKPPIKVTPRKKFKCPECVNNEMLSADLNHMRERSACIDRFARIFGHMPLRQVEFRADPVLFKDNFPEKLKRFNDVGSL